MSGNGVLSIVQDKSKNIWFGTNGGGVSRYDGKKFTNYTTADGLADNFVKSIMQDKNGNLWFGTIKNGVSKFDGKVFTNYTKAQGLADNGILTIVEVKSGDIWFGTNGGGVSRYNGHVFENYTISNGLAANRVESIAQDKSGNIWFGTDKGVSRYDGKSFTGYPTIKGLMSNFVASIVEDNSGNLWFGTHVGGVVKYDFNRFVNYTIAEGLPSNSIHCIVKDKSGNIWFGTSGAGVSRYNGKAVSKYTSVQGLPNGGIWNIMQDKSGALWFGTTGAGASKYDGNGFENYTTLQGLAGNEIHSIIQDKSGAIWFGTDGGASKYDGTHFTNYTTAQGLAHNNIWFIMRDKQDNLWFGTDGGGVSRYDGKTFTNYTTAQGLAGNNVWSIVEDDSGHIWFGTHGGGASRYDGNGFTNYTASTGLPGNSIYNMIKDKSGNIWFGFEGKGASRYDGKGFTNYTTTHGLADNVVYALAEDTTRNIIWFGTNQGLSGLKSDNLQNGGSPENMFMNFNVNNGYPIKDLNVNAVCIDNKGILWGGCGDVQVIRFDYSSIKKESTSFALLIRNIKVNNENICWNSLLPKRNATMLQDSLAILNEMVTTFGKVLPVSILSEMSTKYERIKFDSVSKFYPIPANLVLPYTDNNITLEFAGIDPAMGKHLTYQYKLEGYDKNWSPPGNGTIAVFGNIPEGNYTFKVIATSPTGAHSETSYKFKILPPWYRTWWAYAFYVGCFIAGISLTDRLRRKKIIEKERTKSREKELAQAKEIEKAYEQLKRTQVQLIHSEKMAYLGGLTAGIAHEILNPLNFVNNFSEVNADLIVEMKEEMEKGNLDDANAIANSIKENEQKISEHGKRADAIVKAMLQHSRLSNGQKESTDINLLSREYLQLSFRSFRAQNKSFNAELRTEFDDHVGKINIISQDIGKVLSNLYTNAFYAVAEKSKLSGEDYVAAVSVSTKNVHDQIEIRVRDNGTGVSDKQIDKIFQPFFTTKPTGEGTGLGLSLSYEIIKAHGGELTVNSKEGEFTEFIIQLRKT